MARDRSQRRLAALAFVVAGAAAVRCTFVNDAPRLRFPGAAETLRVESAFDAFPGRIQRSLEPSVCPHVARGVAEAPIEEARLTEASGLAVSARHPDVLWTHNDSGDGPRLFALTEDGTVLATYLLEGATAVDWEDLALGPGAVPGEDDLYIGDVGDNGRARPFVTVHRLREPDPRLEQEGGSGRLTEFRSFHLVYPDGPHDAETLLVDPRSGDLYIVTKEKAGASIVFRAPRERLDLPMLELVEVGHLPFGHALLPTPSLATGGDVSRDGSAVVVRTYTHAFLWRRAEGQSLGDAFRRLPCRLPLPAELQGEAIAIGPEGDAYFTLAEGASSRVWRFDVFEAS